MRTIMILITIALLAFIGSSACINVGSGISPETRYFLLEANSIAMAEGAGQNMLANIDIGIGPVTIPRYLDRPQILTRISDQELQVDEFNQWAEPLKISIPRVLGENLSSLTGGNPIRRFPWKPSDPIDIQVFLDIHRFETDANGKVTLKATWRIKSAKSRQWLSTRTSFIQRTPAGAGIGDKVEAMSVSLSDLSLAIAKELAAPSSSLKKDTGPGV